MKLSDLETEEQGCTGQPAVEPLFFDALAGVASYQVFGDMLQLMDANGDILVNLQRMP